MDINGIYLYNTAMLPQEFSQCLPLMADYRNHDAAHPHRVYREEGANLWILEYAPSGLGVLRTPQGHSRPIQPCTALLFRAGAFQSYGMDPVFGKWEHYYATFTLREHWHEYLTWPEAYPGAWLLEIGEAGKQVEEIFKRLVADFSRRALRQEEILLNYVERILLELDILNPCSFVGRVDPRIRKTMEYIRHHFDHPIDIETLATICNLSQSRFSHLFVSEVGLTPMKYLEQQRLENARGLLAMTHATIEEIARLSGFENPFYFSRQFRRQYQVSPRSYRQHALVTPKHP